MIADRDGHPQGVDDVDPPPADGDRRPDGAGSPPDSADGSCGDLASPTDDTARPAADPEPLPSPADPLVSFIIPARNEAGVLPATLRAIRDQTADVAYEVVVVDGGSDDDTAAVAASFGARVVSQSGTGIGGGRDEGARAARGTFLAFVDADTRVRPAYLAEMLAFVREGGLVAASSRCRITGGLRARALQAVTNRVFPRSDRPTLPGFNTFVRRSAYEAAGGYRSVPNEDKALSRELATVGAVGYHPDVLVETSGRRVEESGLVRTIGHYLRKDLRAIHSRQGDRLGTPVFAAAALALLAGGLQLAHGLLLTHPKAALATAGFVGGVLLFVMDVSRRRLLLYGLVFLTFQWAWWLAGLPGHDHGVLALSLAGVGVRVPLAAAIYGPQPPLAGLLAYLYWRHDRHVAGTDREPSAG